MTFPTALDQKVSNCKEWLRSPIRKDEIGNWINLNNNDTVKNIKEMWMKGQPDGQDWQACTSFNTTTGKLADDGCSVTSCFACTWDHEPLFKLRGLCKSSKIANQYVLLPEYTYNETLFFLGLGKTNILFVKENNSWVIVKDLLNDLIKPNYVLKPSEIIGSFRTLYQSNQMPIGTHLWELNDPECNISRLFPLKLTGVSIL